MTRLVAFAGLSGQIAALQIENKATEGSASSSAHESHPTTPLYSRTDGRQERIRPKGPWPK
jgi:hypothetical protein